MLANGLVTDGDCAGAVKKAYAFAPARVPAMKLPVVGFTLKLEALGTDGSWDCANIDLTVAPKSA